MHSSYRVDTGTRDPLVGVAEAGVPPFIFDVEGRELVVTVVDQSGLFSEEEAKLVELKRNVLSKDVLILIYLPQAKKSEKMKANESFIFCHCDILLLTEFSLIGSVIEIKLEKILDWISLEK